MSGASEVRLYRNTVDEVPLEYTNVTAVVLNSSTKNHATGVKRYLDGVTTVSGLDPGTQYFWVQLIDARGNTAGPQPAGSYTTPSTVWEFFVSASTHHDLGPTLERIQSIPNSLTTHRLIMAEGWKVHIFDNKNKSFE
jgi:predicted phage tail protein